MNSLKRICLVFSISCIVLPVSALSLRLDDSASPRSRVSSSPMLSEQGTPLDSNALGPAPKIGIVKFSRIEYKLATAKFVGKQARIFYVIPPFISGLRSPNGLRVDWRNGNTFASGSAQPGARTLVWTGVINSAFMSDGLDLTMQIELSELQTRNGTGLSFESFFEIEVLE